MIETKDLKLLQKITDDTNIHFHSFEQPDELTFLAHSHFFTFTFTADKVVVSNRYILPGEKLKNYLEENLPQTFFYNQNFFYENLLDTIDEIHDNCIALEYKENFPE